MIKRFFRLIMFSTSVILITGQFSLYAEEYKSYTDIGYIEKTDLTIEQVVDHPDKYHRDIITLDGTIAKLEYKRLITGRKFTLFKLSDDKNNEIKVYARGYIKDIASGTKVRITGRYSKKKSFFFTTYSNVMKANKLYVLKM